MSEKSSKSETNTTPAEAEALRIDVGQLLRQRLPRLSRLLPRRAVRWLEELICQERLNEILHENAGLQGADFCRGALRSLGVTVNMLHEQHLPKNPRAIFVSNHPLGGLDGLALVDLLQSHYGGHVWVIVNDLLMAVKPLESVFLPINKHGRQDRQAVRRIDEVLEGNEPVIMFPAGMVSRYRRTPLVRGSGKTVIDLPWNKMFVTKAIATRRDIVPLHFSGTNSMDFYRAANRRTRLGLKFNYEMLLLPREMVRSQGKSYTVHVGSPIAWQTVADNGDPAGYAHAMGALVYMLPRLVPGSKVISSSPVNSL